jgi:hypothetical protein
MPREIITAYATLKKAAAMPTTMADGSTIARSRSSCRSATRSWAAGITTCSRCMCG